MLTPIQFHDWLKDAKRGERFIYYIGDLQYDREDGLSGQHLRRLADAVYVAHLDGTVILCQRRLGPSRWEYIAIKTTRNLLSVRAPCKSTLLSFARRQPYYLALIKAHRYKDIIYA